MKRHLPATWQEANGEVLAAEVREVRNALSRLVDDPEVAAPSLVADAEWLRARMSEPPAVDYLAELLELSPFERDMLLLAVAVELDPVVPVLCARAQLDLGSTSPTLRLAVSLFESPHVSALAPSRPLIRWSLVDLDRGASLASSGYRIDERILFYVCGEHAMDARLTGIARLAFDDASLVPSHERVAREISDAWSAADDDGLLPLAQVTGSAAIAKRAIASFVAAELGVAVVILTAVALPAAPAELDLVARVWDREAVLEARLLVVDCDGIDSSDPAREAAVERFIASVVGPVLVIGDVRRSFGDRPTMSFDLDAPTPVEQRELWRRELDRLSIDAEVSLERIAAHFNLEAPDITAACAGLGGRLLDAQRDGEELTPELVDAHLWDVARGFGRPRLDDLAQRIRTQVTWEDLVVAEAQREMLSEIVVHVRRRWTVHETWGFARQGRRGLGLCALFSGPSGTGKTLAAEVLAAELRLDLYRIDLSAVVSKYIGETEKNLRKIFDSAEQGGAILLFDEADALFGKRSEVKDSHDRHANVEVGYLLQRIEAFRGLAVLTTNLKDTLDAAFLRRIRFVIDFPFPDAEQRAEIWRRVFPEDAPTVGLDPKRLARMTLTGASIRNVAVAAAFRAAERSDPIRIEHILEAARLEHAKLGRPFPETEVVA